MNWSEFGEVLSYFICFSDSETENENEVEEEAESVSEQLTDEAAATKDSSIATFSIGPDSGNYFNFV